jgi:myo-inositol 2-dehydrogenase/D-chiro-inositol 1-dehydrogenase
VSIKVGIIGFGKMGKLHLRVSRYMKDTKVVAVADPSRRALRAAKKERIRDLYDDYHELLRRADVDAVIITLPNFMHLEATLAAVEAGKHVFVEKPLAMTSADCERIDDAARRQGVKLMVGHNYRFFDATRKLKATYDSGAIGDVVLSTLELVHGPLAPSLESRPVPEWYFDTEKMGMWLLDLGHHVVDLFRWLFGEAEVAYARLDNHYGFPYEDNAIVVLQSRTGPKGVLHTGYFAKLVFPAFDFRVILHGTAGCLSTDQLVPQNLRLHAAKEGIANMLRRITGRRIKPLSYTYFYSSYVDEQRHFFECLNNGGEPAVGARDAFGTIRLIEDVYHYCDRVPSTAVRVS